MRLLNTKSLKLQLFVPSHVPDYVILSHRWSTPSDEECTFQDITNSAMSNPNNLARKKRGFLKISGACNLAVQDGYSWIWIDSCCIDKSSSAELQESINSMWNYYAESNMCYVYMADVPDSEAGWSLRFQNSEWFTRGWTLQELIAPIRVEFYAQDWAPIGTKFERYKEIAEITTIDSKVLVRAQELDIFSAAERLSWAAHREVTRDEDQAYSLLGLFDVNIPLLYGEGRKKAFVRLQEAIYTSTADHSLFLFHRSPHHEDQPLLADSPKRFCEKRDCALCMSDTVHRLPTDILYTNVLASERWNTQVHEQIMTTVTPSQIEVSTTLPLLEYREVSEDLILFNTNESCTEVSHVAVLNHTLSGHMKGALCLLLRREELSEVFQRIMLCPALLPHLGELTSKLQNTKILVCPRPSSSGQNDIVNTTFCISGDSFLVQAWSAKGGLSHLTLPVQGTPNTDLEIHTSISENSKRSAQVSCRIADFQDPTLKISLQLIKIDETWSIKEVSETKQTKRVSKQRTLFISSVLADRCSIRLSDGKRLSVALRRLPAASRARADNFASQHRYQVVVRHL
jgi:hypothetical protein